MIKFYTMATTATTRTSHVSRYGNKLERVPLGACPVSVLELLQGSVSKTGLRARAETSTYIGWRQKAWLSELQSCWETIQSYEAVSVQHTQLGTGKSACQWLQWMWRPLLAWPRFVFRTDGLRLRLWKSCSLLTLNLLEWRLRSRV